MRWILPLLVSAACGTTYESSERGDERIAATLGAPGTSDLIFVAGSRAYYVRNGALSREVDAVSRALSDSVAKSARAGRGQEMPGLSRGDVVAFAYPTGQIEFSTEEGFVRVQRTRDGKTTRYWLTLRASSARYYEAVVPGNPALDNAWLRLEASAARKARENWGASPYSLHIHPAEPVVGPRHDIGIEWNEEK